MQSASRLARVQFSRTRTPGAKKSGGTKQIDTALPDVLPGRAAVLHRKAIQADRPCGSSWRSIAFFPMALAHTARDAAEARQMDESKVSSAA